MQNALNLNHALNDQKYNFNSNIVKYYYHLKLPFYILLFHNVIDSWLWWHNILFTKHTFRMEQTKHFFALMIDIHQQRNVMLISQMFTADGM